MENQTNVKKKKVKKLRLASKKRERHLKIYDVVLFPVKLQEHLNFSAFTFCNMIKMTWYKKVACLPAQWYLHLRYHWKLIADGDFQVLPFVRLVWMGLFGCGDK